MKICEWRLIPKTLAFEAHEYQDRLRRVREGVTAAGLDALILHTPENICYLSGFQTPGYYFPQALIVPLDQDPILITRYIEQTGAFAFSWLPDDRFIAYLDHQDPVTVIVETLQHLSLEPSNLGIEKSGFSSLSIEQYEQLVDLLPRASMKNGSGIVEQERMIKSPAEIGHIRRSCRISELGVRTAFESCRQGMTEHQLAALVNRATTEAGSEYPGLPLFMSSGRRTYIRHAVPSDKVIERGDTVLIELTGVTWRYAGPLFRTISVGSPSDELRHHSDAANEMLEASIRALKPGARAYDVLMATMEVAGKRGVDGGVHKRAGYSVGLNFPPDWGEGHFLDLRYGNETVLKPGMVFHTVQAVRLGDSVPTTVSETVLITQSGNETLTNFFPRDLLVV